ncbi:MAG: hypothetical protein RL172_2361 [Bacteroidota bacterium]|jgi:hypothetical protein
MIKKFLTICAVIIVSVSAVNAQKRSNSYASQDYGTALGVKFYPGAISLKHFIHENKAIEGLGYFWDKGFRLTGLYEIHAPINGAPGLKWYVGPGAHVGFYNNKWGGGSYFGVDGVIGLDYKINNAPINLSLDWQPSFEFGDGSGFTGNWGGFAVRYTF